MQIDSGKDCILTWRGLIKTPVTLSNLSSDRYVNIKLGDLWDLNTEMFREF